MRTLWRIFLWIVICLVLLLIPVIPLQSAPVIVNASYRPVVRSLFKVVSHFANPPDGLSYRMEWYTLVVIVALLAVAVVSGVLLLRRRG
jgi:hypothetical protein